MEIQANINNDGALNPVGMVPLGAHKNESQGILTPGGIHLVIDAMGLEDGLDTLLESNLDVIAETREGDNTSNASINMEDSDSDHEKDKPKHYTTRSGCESKLICKLREALLSATEIKLAEKLDDKINKFSLLGATGEGLCILVNYRS